MSANLISFITVIIAGAAIAMQAPINSALGATAGSNLFAATASFLIGTVCLLLLLIGSGAFPGRETLLSVPWWMWTGGLLGAFYVWAALSNVQSIGVLSLVAAVMLGQLAAALTLDAIGFGNLQTHDISWQRILSVFLVGGGLILSRY